MKLLIKLRNKYFTILTALALVVLSSIGLFNLSTPKSVDATMVKFDNENNLTISNGSFTSFASQSTYPYTLNDYTNSGNKTPEMKTGAINISDVEYQKNYTKYGLTEYANPKGVGTDNYVLMINTKTSSNYTYTSNEFTLSGNKHYYVTVSARTLGDNAVASVFLTKDNVLFEDCLIENISSTEWNNYTFFITTNSYEEVKLKFNMQIGNRAGGTNGCVFFDELHAGEISQDTIIDYISNPSISTNMYRVVNLRTNNYYKEYNFDNAVIQYSNGVASSSVRNYFSTSTSGVGEKNYDVLNNTLTLTATDSYITYKGEEEILDANSYYRFSVFAKSTKIDSGSAFVKLDEIIDEEDEYDDFMESEGADLTPQSSNLKISSVTSNNVTDGYVEYVIYVKTGALNSSKVQFSLGLGDDTENATGNVSFKQFKIERIPYSAYSAVSTSGTLGTIDISSRLKLNSNEIANYSFDQMESDSFDGVPYPATATSWTKNITGEGVQLSGVVNLSAFDNVMEKYNHINTMATPSALNNTLNNNVLMIYNGTNSTHSYTSSAKTLDANKYYKITTFVNTYISGNSNNDATLIIKNGNNILAIADNINTAGTWQKVEFNIHTPANSIDVNLELALGYDNNLACGYAFFDNILIESSDTEDGFSNRFNEYDIANNGSVELDLTNPMLTSTSSREYNLPILYTGSNKGESTVNAGIVDLTGELKMIAESKREALRDIDGDNKNALAIVTALQQDSYYEFASVINYNFSSGSYYKVSFDLFTDGIGQEEKDEMYDNNILAQGVNIELTNLENAKFGYISSEGKWTHYEIYIGLNSTASSSLKFSLGSEFGGCYGRAFLGNIEFTTIEKVDFDASQSSATTLKVDTATSEDESKDTTSSKSQNNFNWAYIPTIATFVAIIVAVIGIFIRRNIKFKKRVKTGKAEYDRDITVMQNKYRRLAQDQRAREVRELTKECEELIALRAEYEAKYKDALNRLRSVKLANRDGSKRHEVIAIEHEVKHISKEVARFGVQVNNYENEIEFMQTEAYLIDLEKRMMREENSSRNQLRKEAEMTEADRADAIAKRKAKQERAEAKAQAKADKLASKQAKLELQRKQVQEQLAEAKALDEKYVKEQELKQIKLEEQKVAKQQLKAQREIDKLERKRRQQEILNVEATETVENIEVEAEKETNSDAKTLIDNEVVPQVEEVVEVKTETVEQVQDSAQTESTETTENMDN
ncbi:MAG: hypothetical protein ACLRFE_01960 [Clostridia bacterium]